jgi:ParB-like chromosome segregation protein Spo0J
MVFLGPPLIEHLPPSLLRPYPNNARTHSAKQIRQIARSIQRFGFTSPALVADDLTILAGHGRIEAAKQLGLETVPVIRLSHLGP